MIMNEDIAQLQSCIPSEDIVPLVLMYDLETLRLFKRTVGGNPDARRMIQIELVQTAKEVWDRGEDVPGLHARIEFIIQSEN